MLVSAGEVVAAAPIVRALREKMPGRAVFLSVVTAAGYDMAGKQVEEIVDGIFYLPFDFPGAVKRTVAFIQPALFVCMESELWPNLLHTLKQERVQKQRALWKKEEESCNYPSSAHGISNAHSPLPEQWVHLLSGPSTILRTALCGLALAGHPG